MKPRVWAPLPDRMELVLEPAAPRSAGARVVHPMDRDASGWWSADLEVPPGADYGFMVDGAGPFPDPRSPHQPSGVHGLSRAVDHGSFHWSDRGWQPRPLATAVIYELHVGTFTATGTFDGVIDRLDHLVDLGITHVELMPVVEFPGDRGWGYDGVDLFAPHHAYGGPDGLKRLVDACHARGLAVLIDVAGNHLGPDGNYLPRSRRTSVPDTARRGAKPSTSTDRLRRGPPVRARQRQPLAGDYHADGLRIDAVHEIFDRSATHILETVAAHVHALGERVGRDLVVIAESDLNDPRVVRDVELGGYGLDAQWNDDLRHAIHVALTGETDAYHAQYSGTRDIAAALDRVFVYDGRYRRSETNAWTSGRRPSGDPVIGFIQNHDQVGNRAMGERISQLVSPDVARVGAALVLLGPFVPLLFAGEEWAASTPFQYFTAHENEDLGDAIREGRRREFPARVQDRLDVPDPQAFGTFERSCLDWSERADEPHASMLAWYRQLIAFQAAHPELRDGSRPAVTLDAAAGWLVMTHGGLRVVANLGPEPRNVPIGGPEPWRPCLASTDGVALADGHLRMPAWSIAVVEPGP